VYAAAAKGHTAVIQALHSAKADIDQRDWCADVDPLSDIVLLLFCFCFSSAAFFTSHAAHSDFQTPLWAAVDKGFAAAATALIDLGADEGSFSRCNAFVSPQSYAASQLLSRTPTPQFMTNC
jgi:hypothetical protein